MAHFAELDANNVVLRVIVVNDDVNNGENFCRALLGGQWKQTTYTNTLPYIQVTPGRTVYSPTESIFRKNYAGPGYTYDVQRDAFIPPRSYASWVLNEATCQWDSPIPYPTDGNTYEWDETTQQWSSLRSNTVFTFSAQQ